MVPAGAGPRTFPVAEAGPLTVEATLEGTRCRLQATNTGARPVYVFDCDSMPYLLQEGAGLLVLHGMHEPPPEADYWGIEIPATRPLEPGDVLHAAVDLDPLWVRSHYGAGDPFRGLASPTRVRTAVGWGATPLDAAALASMSLQMVCRDWQHLAPGPDLTLP